ncbi:MAG: sialidase family protein [Chitinophagaceae bacterium]
MKLFLFLAAISLLLFLPDCKDEKAGVLTTIIGIGQMPVVVKDNSGNIHVVYGNGDSILYSYSTNSGRSFSAPSLISVVPKLSASHTRGPQIAATAGGLIVTACNENGDIFSFNKKNSGQWVPGARVNDRDTVAKENLMSLSGDDQSVFAVWLDLRDKHNKIFGAKSTDGGKTWSTNFLIYASPDATVCECCKPSVQVKANNVYVMFRNWLYGNRDLYLVQSSDGGTTFGQAQKLGNGNWALNGCPMDGGGMALNNEGRPETIWNRKGIIYACKPGREEMRLGEGRSCTIESIDNKNIYAWVQLGHVILMKPRGEIENLGKGQLPVIKAINNDHILCVWENDKQVQAAIIDL